MGQAANAHGGTNHDTGLLPGYAGSSSADSPSTGTRTRAIRQRAPTPTCRFGHGNIARQAEADRGRFVYMGGGPAISQTVPPQIFVPGIPAKFRAGHGSRKGPA